VEVLKVSTAQVCLENFSKAPAASSKMAHFLSIKAGA